MWCKGEKWRAEERINLKLGNMGTFSVAGTVLAWRRHRGKYGSGVPDKRLRVRFIVLSQNNNNNKTEVMMHSHDIEIGTHLEIPGGSFKEQRWPGEAGPGQGRQR